jgi:hypothetical protein
VVQDSLRARSCGRDLGIVSVVTPLGMVIDAGFLLLVLWVLAASAVMLRKPATA